MYDRGIVAEQLNVCMSGQNVGCAADVANGGEMGEAEHNRCDGFVAELSRWDK